MARERWPKDLRSSGANQRALRSSSGFFLSAMVTPVRSFDRVMSQAIHGKQGPLAQSGHIWTRVSAAEKAASGRARGRHHDPDEVSGISRAQFFHDVGAV